MSHHDHHHHGHGHGHHHGPPATIAFVPEPVVLREPIPSPAWLHDVLTNAGRQYLQAVTGVPLAQQPHATVKLMLFSPSCRRFLCAPHAASAELRHADPASAGEEFRWTLMGHPGAPGSWALRNSHGRYLRADVNDGGLLNMATVRRVDCNSPTSGPPVQGWEAFRVRVGGCGGSGWLFSHRCVPSRPLIRRFARPPTPLPPTAFRAPPERGRAGHPQRPRHVPGRAQLVPHEPHQLRVRVRDVGAVHVLLNTGGWGGMWWGSR